MQLESLLIASVIACANFIQACNRGHAEDSPVAAVQWVAGGFAYYPFVLFTMLLKPLCILLVAATQLLQATFKLVLYPQLHATSESSASCNPEGRLQIRQQDLVSIFITSTAELPGMLFASLLVDVIGRKRWVVHLVQVLQVYFTCYFLQVTLPVAGTPQ